MKKLLLSATILLAVIAYLALPCKTQAAPSDYCDTVQKAYIGYYQRPADPGGLVWWAERIDEANGNVSTIMEAFATSDESKALYGDVNNTTISNVVDGDLPGRSGRRCSTYVFVVCHKRFWHGSESGSDNNLFGN